MKKRLFSILLCLVMAVTLLPTAAMAAGRFTDVTEKNWFYADVEYAVAQGLVNGTTATTYSPNSNLTYGAAIKLAACMHKKVTQGNTDFTVGSPWYQVYVDYAQANGIIPTGKTYDWDANATRAGYMEIFANAIPDTGLRNGYTELVAMNKVDDGAIPDVSMTHPQAAAIYKLYRAGILQGSDAVTHQCNPNNYIQRSEVATILTRMMDANARIAFEMTSGETPSADGLTIAQQPADTYAAPGGSAEFTVAVSGGKGPYTYKWYLSADGVNWTAIVNSSKYSGVSTAKLTVKADASTSLSYRCKITDANGTVVYSNAATLTERSGGTITRPAAALAVEWHPADVFCDVGEWVSFSVGVTGGTAPYTYQWQSRADDVTSSWGNVVNSSVLKGGTTAKLETQILEEDLEYGYQYRCKITDASETVVYSNAAAPVKRQSGGSNSRPTVTPSTGSTTDTGSTVTRPEITVSGGLTIKTQPKSASAAFGEKVSFTVEISGGQSPYTHQWQCSNDGGETWTNVANSTKYGGVQTATLTVKIDSVRNDNASLIYRCKISDAAHNEVYSNSVTAVCARTSTSR